MEKLHVVTTVSNGIIQVLLDDVVILNGSGERTVEGLNVGEKFILTWFVKGAAGSTYSVKVDSPDSAKTSVKKTLGSGGKDFGGFTFRP